MALTTALAALAVHSAAPPSSPPAHAEAAAPVSAATAQAVEWARSALHLSGWRLVSASPELLVFAKPAPGEAGANPRIMVRGEHVPLAPRNPIGSGESFMNLGELDCQGGRERTLRSTVYAGADLQGAILAGSDDPGAWGKITPASPVGLEASALCAQSAAPPASRRP